MAIQDSVDTRPSEPIVIKFGNLEVQLGLSPLKSLLLFAAGILVTTIALGLLVPDFRFYVYCITGDSSYCIVTNPRDISTAAVDATAGTILHRPVVPNGTYTAERGYTERARPSPTQACQASYSVPDVIVQDGEISFTSDNGTRIWSGTIDQQTGTINIDNDRIRPPTGSATYIRGNYRNAKAYSGRCGVGFFRLVFS